MRSRLSTLRRAIRKPRKIPSHLARRASGIYGSVKEESFRRRYSIPNQKPYLREFISQKEFAVIILDACRYDAFEKRYDQYFTGDISPMWSSGHWTAEYFENTWDGYHDLTYINAAPVISDFYFEDLNKEMQPEQHFRETLPIWETGWNGELGTTPAEAVTDAALRTNSENDKTRLVAHYIQPHFPYIGDRESAAFTEYMDIRDPAQTADRRELLGGNGPQISELWTDKVTAGVITKSDVQQAYMATLEYVLNEARRLIQELDCPVVMTADHGEHLGESGRYLHEESSKYTRTVPWLRVDSVVGSTESTPLTDAQGENTENDAPVNENTVEERLADLGYL